ncbi:MAG: RES family NAD+ phosphorylase [Gammaproteobacteria bacterium]|nr:RES family NAD+ phosphorylase [Gammaproteobacteria bacterium]MBU1654660.1 RES family NAD+ phosphorylase [Gammaproteobacteria bacterium]MBU1961383.1 RES family NAD+ phosphorylase [Gammaproteobacteria bacterium]
MNRLFAGLALADVHRDIARNIVSLRESQDLFDDLTDDPSDWLLAQKIEDQVKPPPYRSSTPVIHRPFEDAEWFNAIAWPFTNRQASRFSDGTYGVWYGSDTVETSVFESAYHWYHGLLSDAGFENEPVIGERKVYWVACDAALLDFRRVTDEHPGLLHRTDYTYPRSVGARIHREGHPGLLIPSVRRPEGENYALFNPAVLSNPRHNCQLSYRLEAGRIRVQKKPGTTWLSLEVAGLSGPNGMA